MYVNASTSFEELGCNHLHLEQDSLARIPLHKIPNIAFAKLDVRGQSNLFFPALYRTNQQAVVDKETMAKFYNKVLRPTLAQLAEEQMIRWPATYDLAIKQAKDVRGEFHFGTIDIGLWVLDELEEDLLAALDGHREFQDAFWVHDFRGIKGQTAHDIDSMVDREGQLEEALSFLDIGNRIIHEHEWYIDVGVEIFSPHHVLQWLTMGHKQLLQHVLPNASERQIDRLERSQEQFKIDYEAQLFNFAGFRTTPQSRGARDQVVYIQAYSPAKHTHYQMHPGIYRRRKAADTLPGKITKLIGDCGTMYELFATARGNGDINAAQDSSVRIEARVRVDHVQATLVTFSEDLVNHTIVAVPTATWW